jgi:uncharacterized protein (DUF2164 family)
MPIALSIDEKKQAIASIRRYCAEELDLDLGDLKADFLLQFFLTEIAPSVYNAAIAHAQAYLRDRAADLDGVCYAAPFSYWPKPSAPRAT